jgi:hypothetical protein
MTAVTGSELHGILRTVNFFYSLNFGVRSEAVKTQLEYIPIVQS